MDLGRRTRRNLAPVVGGITAVATATGAFAAVTHVVPAGAGQDSAGPALGAAGLTGAGTFESCEAYFGFGKRVGVSGVVDFDVLDINGDDGVAHDVDADTNVRLVLENKIGEVIECVPFEITGVMWEEEFENEASLPSFPGPGHYAYPSVNLEPSIPDFGEITAVGFRVTTIPGEHTLVSPEGVKALPDFFLPLEAVFFGEIIDQAVLDYIAASTAGAAGAAAFEDAIDACVADIEYAVDDADLVAAANVLAVLVGRDPDFTQVFCNDVGEMHLSGSLWLGIFASVAHVEQIQLQVPEAPQAPPAAQPAEAAPAFTG